MALDSEPMSVVTVTIGSSNPDVKPAPASLEFDTDNWKIEQQVTVSAARDSDVHDETATLTHTASGADYGGVKKDLVVTVRGSRCACRAGGVTQEPYSDGGGRKSD